MKLLIRMSFVLLINLFSCGDSIKTEGSKAGGNETTEEFDGIGIEEEDYEVGAAPKTEKRNELGTYCCEDHNPAHCGNVEEVDLLAEEHGCLTFE